MGISTERALWLVTRRYLIGETVGERMEDTGEIENSASVEATEDLVGEGTSSAVTECVRVLDRPALALMPLKGLRSWSAGGKRGFTSMLGDPGSELERTSRVEGCSRLDGVLRDA